MSLVCGYLREGVHACMRHTVFCKLEGCVVLCLNNDSSVSHSLHFAAFADISQQLSEQWG